MSELAEYPSSPSPSGSVISTSLVEGWSNLDARTPDLPDVAGAAWSYSWPAPEWTKGCTRKWNVVACECEARVYQAGCTKLTCESCEPHLRARRAASIRDRIERVRGARALVYTILTVPPELREAAADVKIWNKWRAKIWRWLKKNAGGVFAVERSDPAGDSDPGLWHPHLNLLWLQRDGFTGFLKVDALRAAWREIIGAKRPVNVYSQYSANERKLGAWYWYMGRTWPHWAKTVKRHLTVRWMGDYPRVACTLEKVGDRELACECKRARGCTDCGAQYVVLRVGDRQAAEEVAELGPAEVRARVDAIWEESVIDGLLNPFSRKRLWE